MTSKLHQIPKLEKHFTSKFQTFVFRFRSETTVSTKIDQFLGEFDFTQIHYRSQQWIQLLPKQEAVESNLDLLVIVIGEFSNENSHFLWKLFCLVQRSVRKVDSQSISNLLDSKFRQNNDGNWKAMVVTWKCGGHQLDRRFVHDVVDFVHAVNQRMRILFN